MTFLFGFGNVLSLALRLDEPMYVAPLVAPAVDLSVLGLLLGTRYLALHGARPEQLRPARRLLLFASLVTLAVNVAEPICAGQFGKTAFDPVGPLLLTGWAEVGPGLLQAISAAGTPSNAEGQTAIGLAGDGGAVSTASCTVSCNEPGQQRDDDDAATSEAEELVSRAVDLDVEHWLRHRRPISAETLRRELGVGSARARALVKRIRSGDTSVGEPLVGTVATAGPLSKVEVAVRAPCLHLFDVGGAAPARRGQDVQSGNQGQFLFRNAGRCHPNWRIAPGLPKQGVCGADLNHRGTLSNLF
ncbi:hypothetical protein ACWEV3_15635 [Saccharopolyspora sp. NPDC003752]